MDEKNQQERQTFLKDDLRVFVVPTDILYLEDLDIYEKMAYIVLRSFTNSHNPVAWPSMQTIADLGGMSKSKAKYVIKSLEEKGLIEKEIRLDVTKNRRIKNTSNLYTIKNPQKESTQSHHDRGVGHTMTGGRSHHDPEHNHLTKSIRKESINNNIEKQESIEFAEVGQVALNQPKQDVVVEDPNSIQSVLKNKGLQVTNGTLVKWNKLTSKENIISAIEEATSKKGIGNVVGYITGMLEKGYTPASPSSPSLIPMKTDIPEWEKNRASERGDNNVISPEQQKEALDLLFKLGEISQDRYEEEIKKVLTGR